MSAYVLAVINVEDPVKYGDYASVAPATVEAFGGRYLARDGKKHPLEGAVFGNRVVVLEFPSVEAANRWYHSDEYQAVRRKREGAAQGDIFVIEGYAHPSSN
ncbi:Uncharacterized conserved protein, DUF1330 family [Variovorax sp. HW608]|uniref:DUF1330 domain-containing protein n=1 Tax=Variovorax sp. HW608 TaxID=1034889 RepID=UPI00081FA804|nr:DUF1330 domain-containing protein [Variovorax sp. HW608]SCK09778.1 Uncharacterized conserved protein, DUF1330 family [Variovorax sp. HW608]